jgi:hypothetical protein
MHFVSLKRNNHILDQADKVFKSSCISCGLIRRCFTNLTSEKVSILYKSIVRPILEYGSTVWSPYLVKDTFTYSKYYAFCFIETQQPYFRPS